jgi:hypothetical protein
MRFGLLPRQLSFYAEAGAEVYLFRKFAGEQRMYESESGVNLMLIEYSKLLLAEIPDERMAEQPVAGVNHPAWVLGHLAISADLAIRLLGGERLTPKEWVTLFGPGSAPTTTRGDYPAKAELVRLFEQTFATARELAKTADPEKLAGPNPNARLRVHLPTAAGAVALLLTGHLGLHLGQISTWRRLIGLPAMF